MTKVNKLSALMKKNLILMKKFYFTTCCELFFPPLMMFLIVLIRTLVEKEDITVDPNDKSFLDEYSISAQTKAESETFLGLNNLENPFEECIKAGETTIGVFEENDLTKEVTLRMPLSMKTKLFSTEKEMDDYAESPELNSSPDFPVLCFGFGINSSTYDYTIKYYTSEEPQGFKKIPETHLPSLDPFQQEPNIKAFNLWKSSGYLYLMRLIQEAILKKETNKHYTLNFAVVSQKFTNFTSDEFAGVVDSFLIFVVIVAFTLPLIRYSFRMSKDKETRLKEGMKIMGLDETTYFLSYFLQYLLVNLFNTLAMSAVLIGTFRAMSLIFTFLMLFFFGMALFSVIFFFQSFVSKTKICVIMSLLLYFVMFFLSIPYMEGDSSSALKHFLGLMPPGNLLLGNQSVVRFEATFREITFGNMFEQINNYSFGNMLVMFVFDFFFYLFLGFYLQNVVPQKFGSSKPWNFLFTWKYWVGEETENAQFDLNEIKQLNSGSEGKTDFQDESDYEDKFKSGDCLLVRDLCKQFGDGKKAVENLNINMYQDEIFALLGHNGAGKSTTLSILSGLYGATSGKAFYKNYNIFENIDEFRKSLGICPQHDVLFDNLNAKEHLNLFADFKGVPKENIESEVEKIMTDLSMEDIGFTLAKNLSGGQKRKLSIAIALVGGSKVVFLDEPTAGMDITSRRKLWDILKNCTSGRIVILTTHYMEEAAILGNRIGIMSQGTLKCSGNTLFLVDRFGKFVSVNVTLKEDANSEEIQTFFRTRIPEVEVNMLSNEILFKIPKSTSVKFAKFFHELDENTDTLKIKSYSASMPTLEDVFINTSSDKRNYNAKTMETERVKLVKTAGFERNPSFWTHIRVLLKKRGLLITRDSRTLFLDIFSPLIVVIGGIWATKMEVLRDPPQRETGIASIPGKNYVPVSNQSILPSDTLPSQLFKTTEDIEILSFQAKTPESDLEKVQEFLTSLENLQTPESFYISYLIIQADKEKRSFSYVTAVNMFSQDAPIISAHFAFESIFSLLSSKKAPKLHNNPFPIEYEIKGSVNSRRDSNLLFFTTASMAFIPANIISILIRERETNAKHLQIISGVSYLTYWATNFIFDYFKYYVFAGISILMIEYFTEFEYFYIFMLLYGLALVPYTYVFSFLFKTENKGQNTVLVFNMLFGVIISNVTQILLTNGPTVNFGRFFAWIGRINPVFSFGLGANSLHSRDAVFFAREGGGYRSLNLDIYSFEYAGADIAMILIWTLVSFALLVVIEGFGRKIKGTSAGKEPEDIINDDGVLSDIKKAAGQGDYAIKVSNLEKIFKTGSVLRREQKIAVNRLNMCLEKGECFALLGVNGAGKTTTFKCLTGQLNPSSGSIELLNQELKTNFTDLRVNIGYCPQSDGFFDYMTVRENLELYASLRGFNKEAMEMRIELLMRDLNIAEYKDKISGKLSGGNKRKLSVAIALLSEPEIILLDEPSAGMDPEARRFMWSTIHQTCQSSTKSTVVLSTHSIEEAETLCSRLGIMVDGQFKCLGTFQTIKDTYGEGFEVDLTIENVKDDSLYQKMGITAEQELSLDQLKSALERGGFESFVQELSQGRMGTEIYIELAAKGKISGKRAVNWVFHTSMAVSCMGEILENFPEIELIEIYGSSFKARIAKNSQNSASIGFLFSKFEELQHKFNVTAYAVFQTSLEQIFNKFANEVSGTRETSTKYQIKLSSDFVSHFAI